MSLALFARTHVSDPQAATEWYGRLLGNEPSFLPNDTEAVWGSRRAPVDVHQAAARGRRPSVVTIFVDDLDKRVAAMGMAGDVGFKNRSTGMAKGAIYQIGMALFPRTSGP